MTKARNQKVVVVAFCQPNTMQGVSKKASDVLLSRINSKIKATAIRRALWDKDAKDFFDV